MKVNLMKGYLTSGEVDSYFHDVLKKIIPFLTSRMLPFLSFNLMILALSRSGSSLLADFVYVTSLYSIPVVFFSMPLALIGNFSNESNGLEGFKVFIYGIPTCIVLSLLSFFSGIFIDLYATHYTVRPVEGLSLYKYCVPMLVINTYLYIYSEGAINNKVTAKIKSVLSILSVVLVYFCYFKIDFISVDNLFSIFILIEFFTLIIFSLMIFKYSKSYFFDLEFKRFFSECVRFLKLGYPLSLGMIGQKVIFFLLTYRLMGVSDTLVSHLSIVMVVIGFFSIPIASYAQIHSIYISSKSKVTPVIFNFGLMVIFSFSILFFIIILVGGDFIFSFFDSKYGSNSILFFISLFFLFLSMSVVQFIIGHLRSLRDTKIPQITVNVVMFFIFLPMCYLVDLHVDDLCLVIFMQSAALFFAAIFLYKRLVSLEGFRVRG